jgi:flavin-binding protein dodecin
MSNHVYKKVDLVGSSHESIEAAIENAISKAAKTVKHMDWFEVVETRGVLRNNKIDYYQVVLKVGFRLE